jgi:hypothetical protein
MPGRLIWSWCKRPVQNIPKKAPLNCRSLGFARDDKGKGDALVGIGCWLSKTAGPSTALRSGRDDNSVARNRFRRDDGCCSPTVLHGSVALLFVIPSEAERSAVLLNQQPMPTEASLSSLSSRPERSAMEGPAVLLNQQPMPTKASPSPLSSRATPRDLQFSGPFLGMFSLIGARRN